MRAQSLYLAIVVVAHLLISSASAVDSDGDGLLDLIDVPGFDPNASFEVDFTRRGIEDLDGASLLTDLRWLYLGSNQITSVEGGDFDGLTELLVLKLGGNQITSIENGAFQGLTKLKALRPNMNDMTELNFTGAVFENFGGCRFLGDMDICRIDGEIASLVLDDATLSRRSFDAIVGPNAYTDVSLVGLTFSDKNPDNLNALLLRNTLNNVTVSQTLFRLYADEFNAFDAMNGNTVTVVPDLGDYNANGKLDAGDLNLQAAAIQSGQNPEDFDLTYDRLVDADDRIRWVEDLKNTYFGDANLDGEFNSSDLITVLGVGEFEDAIELNSSWATGDWNADGEFTSADLIAALADGGFEKEPRVANAAVPEPTSAVLLIGMLVIVWRRRWPCPQGLTRMALSSKNR